MVKKVFFNPSLPRSGSTLLQNVLIQNPEIYSTPTSGVIEFLLQSRTIYTSGDSFKAQDPEVMKEGFRSFCKSGLYGFFNGITDRPYVMEKSRGWLGSYNFIEFFDPGVKMICMVRDLRSIFSSMEKNYRKNPHKDPMMVDAVNLKNMTTPSRVDHFSVSPPIGPSLEWLNESFNQGFSDKILFIRFEDFTRDPESQMVRIYDYLEIPYYKHDFNNVEQLTHENDVIHGIFGDHKIKKQITPIEPDYYEILGGKECDRIKNHYSWYFEAFNYF
jgi:sulfotransferase